MKVTIVDIAKRLKITPSTVSRALANNERVSEKTRALVKKTATEMGYQPNQLASSLRKGVSDSIGMVVPRINRHFFSNVICGVEQVLNEAGYNLTILQSSESLRKEKSAIDTLRKSRVGGVIISLSIETDEYSHLIELNEQIPMVQFDRVYEGISGPKLVNDNYHGAYEATMHLINGGGKRFLHLAGSSCNKVYEERKRGFQAAINQAGISASRVHIVEGSVTREAGLEVIYELWKSKSFDAIFCAGDYLALGAIEALARLGLKVPEQVKIVGFANEPFSELMTPSLSSMEQYGEKMGQQAAQAMLDKIKDNSLNYTEVVPVSLICRESTK